LLIAATRWGRITQGRRAAAMALAVLMRGRRDREARDVREHLEHLLLDPDFRVQAAAVEAVALIGDPAAIPALRHMIERELDGRLRRRGKEVIRDLEDGTSSGEDLRRMRDEVGELRTLTTTLRERLELLEARGTGAAHTRSTTSPRTKVAKRAKPPVAKMTKMTKTAKTAKAAQLAKIAKPRKR
jgi:aminopeptidase N